MVNGAYFQMPCIPVAAGTALLLRWIKGWELWEDVHTEHSSRTRLQITVRLSMRMGMYAESFR
jgi:hypothetical protein